jgi:hypothetical protein
MDSHIIKPNEPRNAQAFFAAHGAGLRLLEALAA